MKKFSIRQIPVLDQSGILKDIKYFDEIYNTEIIQNPVLIMAGGRGKRMMPLTKKSPKPMLEVKGRPMLEIILEKLYLEGFRNIFISVNYLKDEIINYFGNGKKLGFEDQVSY